MGLLLLSVSPTSTAPPAVTTPAAPLGLADLALLWDNIAGGADLVRAGTDLQSDAGLTTAVLLSMFLDRRAANDDVPPSGKPTDRRGWWADMFSDIEGDQIGSRLWLLDRSKATRETAQLAKEYTAEALQWLLDDQVAASVDITTQLDTTQPAAPRLLISATVPRPGKDAVSFAFAHVWDAMATAA